MFQEQSFRTELCVNDSEHRLTERGHKKWNGTSATYSVLLLPLQTKMLAKASIASAYTVIVAISLISGTSVSHLLHHRGQIQPAAIKATW
jgi:hypothetical protein